jgi:hypothetical protein
MTRRLKRIAVVKFGLVVGIFYGLFSLILVPFMLFGIILGGLASMTGAHGDADSGGSAAAGGIGIVFGLVMCVVLPIVYAVLGGLVGMLMAAIYNLVARWTGGIEVDVE